MNNQINPAIAGQTNVSKRYDFGNGHFIHHELNGIKVFILPDSIEGRLINFIQSYQYSQFGRESNPDFKELSRKFKQWNDSKGFDWD